MKKQKTQVDEVKSWLRKQNTKQLKTFCLFIEAVLKERHQKDEDKALEDVLQARQKTK